MQETLSDHLDSPQSCERRKWPRQSLNDVVGVATAPNSWTTGLGRDLSAGGIYFTCSSRLALGSGVELLVQGSPSDLWLCKGKVVRVEANRRDGFFGMALAFEEVKTLEVPRPLARAATGTR